MVLWVGSCKKCFVIGGSLPPARLEHDSAKFVASTCTCNCWTMEPAWRTAFLCGRWGFLWLLRLNQSHVFRWNHFVPLSLGLRVPSNRLWQAPWTELRPLWTCFTAEMWRTAEQRCPHFSRRSHKKHVSVFCDSFDSICLLEWTKA
jgi:hypothetical protein